MQGPGLDNQLRYGHPESGWFFIQRSPPAALRPFVHGLQGYVEVGLPPIVRKQTPVASYPVIFVFGPGFTLREAPTVSNQRCLRRSFAVGLHRSHAVVGSLGSSICMQANLTPQGARGFLGCDLAELSDTIVDLNCLIGASANSLESQLEEAVGWDHRFDLLERFLLERIVARSDSHAIAVEGWRMLLASQGRMPISELAARLGCSRKHLSQVFKREVGVSAKRFARLSRFEHACERIRAEPGCSLASIAQDCGYVDQPHFNREFLDFSGETPCQFRTREAASDFATATASTG